MIHSHELKYTLFVDSIEELEVKFYGSSLEMQELELILDSTLQPQTIYQQQIKKLINGITDAYDGKMEYILELGYNFKLLNFKEGKEEHHEL